MFFEALIYDKYVLNLLFDATEMHGFQTLVQYIIILKYVYLWFKPNMFYCTVLHMQERTYTCMCMKHRIKLAKSHPYIASSMHSPPKSLPRYIKVNQ